MAAYTTIDDPSALFQVATYTGAGANTVVTNGGNSDLKPDLLWIKNRTAGYAHFVVDSNRNISYAQNSSNAPYLETDSTATENNNQNWMASVNTDGFTTGIAEHTNCNSGSAYVAWQWKANGGTTTSFTESGNNPGGNRQTNTAAGFSIIDYTGTGANASCALAHGLGKAPELVIFKRRNATNWWATYHQGIGVDYKLALQDTGAKDADGAFMNGTIPDATNIYVGGTSVHTNADNGTYICYAWTEIQGYSKFGSYVGNGDANGAFAYTGFKPAFVMIKCTAAASHWAMFDSKRAGYNDDNYRIYPNLVNAENTGETNINFLSNGFKLLRSDTDVNNGGSGYVYMAFAENPFVTSTGTPTTAR